MAPLTPYTSNILYISRLRHSTEGLHTKGIVEPERHSHRKVSASYSGQCLIPDTLLVLSNERIPGLIIWLTYVVSHGPSANQN